MGHPLRAYNAELMAKFLSGLQKRTFSSCLVKNKHIFFSFFSSSARKEEETTVQTGSGARTSARGTPQSASRCTATGSGEGDTRQV